jgi:hypothetical protein
MSPLASAPDAPTRLRSAVEIGIAVVGVLLAVGVAVLFLVLMGAGRTAYAPRPRSPRYVPLSQYAPVVAPPTATVIQSEPARQAPPSSVRAAHSNGIVPSSPGQESPQSAWSPPPRR